MRTLLRIAAVLLVLARAVPVLGAAPEPPLGSIALVDQSGSPFHLRDLAGRPAAITFVATRCRDTCPIVNALFERLSREGPPAHLVTVTLDPAYDTPIVMANYARRLEARAPGWRFVTGSQANIARVLRAFSVGVERGRDGFPDAHSDLIYVVDRKGQLRRTVVLSTNAYDDVRGALAQ
jgi:protein SCO1